MKAGIEEGKTRGDHRAVADQVYALYAEGRDLRRLVAIIGEAALSVEEQLILIFADQFEARFIHQGVETDRHIDQTLDLAWELMSPLPASLLKRIPEKMLHEHRREVAS